MLTHRALDKVLDVFDTCPWSSLAGRRDHDRPLGVGGSKSARLYTDDERRRRDASPWTLVQGVLAPIQFVVFLVSLGLVLRYLAFGVGETAADVSIMAKTLVLYTIMITGAIWEKDVFGRYLFAPAFYWEDMFSMLVLALHTLYLFALAEDLWGAEARMFIALAAYAAYVINAGQFLMKLRMARLEGAALTPTGPLSGRAK